jgi:hypothetical protein
MEFVQENLVYILAFLLAFSELLAQVPSIKSNSVFQLVVSVLKSVAESVKGKPKA